MVGVSPFIVSAFGTDATCVAAALIGSVRAIPVLKADGSYIDFGLSLFSFEAMSMAGDHCLKTGQISTYQGKSTC
jgi:hypothetical protein